MRPRLDALLLTAWQPLALLAQSQRIAREPNPWAAAGLAAVLVCVWRRKRAIGGWLLYFFLWVFANLARSILVLGNQVAHYVPSRIHALALTSTAPGTLALLAVAAISVLLWKSRDAQWLIPLRAAMVLKIGTLIVSVAIDWAYFPGDLAFDAFSVVWFCVFLVYFFVSKRVRQVFRTRDNQTEGSSAAGPSAPGVSR